MINLSLGLTDEQIRRRHLTTQQQITGTPEQIREAELELSPQIEDFATPPAEDTAIAQMKKNYPNTDTGNRKLWTIMEKGNEFGKRNTAQKKALIFLYDQRKKEHPDFFKKLSDPSIQAAIDKATNDDIIRQIATLHNAIVRILREATFRGTHPAQKKKAVALFYATTKKYNRLVQGVGKRGLTIDTAKTLAQKRIVPRY